MSDEMGQFRVDLLLENPALPGEKRLVRNALVVTGAELTWIPREILESLGVEHRNVWHFRQADGSVLERWSGFVLVEVGGRRTADEVIFGEPNDLILLGARSLEGLNFRIEIVTKQLVDAGPSPVAVAA
jgi:predicted aspartyl protease